MSKTTKEKLKEWGLDGFERVWIISILMLVAMFFGFVIGLITGTII
jgi:hypothetical protein